MTSITYILLALAFIVYESFWRRWFGGKKLSWLGFLDRRWFKHVVNSVVLAAIAYFMLGLSVGWAAYLIAVIEGLHWSLAHGPWFDYGRGGMPDEKMFERYNKVWFAKILNWCFPEEHKYGHFYDFCGMLARYTWPLLLLLAVPGINLGMLVLGELITIEYGICHVAKDKSIIKKHGATEIAEYIAGALTALFLVAV